MSHHDIIAHLAYSNNDVRVERSHVNGSLLGCVCPHDLDVFIRMSIRNTSVMTYGYESLF